MPTCPTVCEQKSLITVEKKTDGWDGRTKLVGRERKKRKRKGNGEQNYGIKMSWLSRESRGKATSQSETGHVYAA